MENVVGILTMKTTNNESVKNIIMEQLSKNFHVSYQILYAPDFGVPQKRKRVFFFGLHKNHFIKPINILQPKFSKEEYIPVKNILTPREEVEPKYYLSQKAIDGINRRKIKMKAEGKGFGAQFLKLDEPIQTELTQGNIVEEHDENTEERFYRIEYKPDHDFDFLSKLTFKAILPKVSIKDEHKGKPDKKKIKWKFLSSNDFGYSF